MLRIPSFTTHDDLTVYQDDAVWTRFYVVPSKPRIRRDAEGRPVFLLTVFHRSDQQREEAPTVPEGGGFMNFDVEFAVDEAALEVSRTKLQAWVDETHAQRRADPQYAGLAEYADAVAPRVQLADPLLSGGTVRMHTMQNAQLVSARLAEAPASLVNGSTAVFNLDLTPDGADLMKGLFLNPGGEGRIDLTPVQIQYDQRMWARLPPVTIVVTGDSERIHQTLKSATQQRGDNVCTPAEIETFRENTLNSSTLRETGAVTVKIDQGDATVPLEVVQALQDYALELFDTMLAERFMAPADEATQPLDFDDDDPALVAPGGGLRRTSRLRPWRSRAWGTTTGRYKVAETIDTASMHLEIRIERSQVVEWPTGGSATLQTFFEGASEAEMRRHVVELTTSSFDSLSVNVRAFVDFAKQPVRGVEVQMEYHATDADGQPHDFVAGHTFTATEAGAWRFDPRIVGGQTQYRWRHRVLYSDGSGSDYGEWATTDSRECNIAVPVADRIGLEASAASLNWDLVRGVRVDLSYVDPQDASAAVGRSLELTKLNPVRTWEQPLRGRLRGNIIAKCTWFLVDDKVVEGPAVTREATDTLFIVPPPQVDVLNVALVPAGQWGEVAQAVVQMKYDAGGGIVYDRVFRFTSIEQTAEWAVLLRDSTRRSFSYQTVVSFKNGGKEESPWTERSGDQALLIEVKGVPRLRVNLLPNLVDFARTPAVQVTLAYGDQRRTLAFTGSQPQVWEVPLAADGARDYTWEIVWHPANGEPISSGLQRGTDTEFFIPKATLPTAGKLEVMVRGFALDFGATPFVDVSLAWQDAVREERKTLTLTREQPNQTWSVEVGDRSQRRYRYAITYNLADGSRVDGAHGETDDPVISVRRP